MTHRSLLVLALATAALLTSSTRAQQPRKAPSIVLILTDDQGYADLGCYGSSLIKTPHIDRLAKEGIRFTDFYSPASVCTPSRAAMLTGCYPQRVGMGEIPPIPNGKPWMTRVLFRNAPFGLNPDEVTIPEMLKSAGYATACIGKWHLGDQKPFLPGDHGFDYHFGILYTNDMPPVDFVRDGKKVEEKIDQTTITSRYTEEALKFIRDKKDKPFFIFLSHTMPHVPLFASEQHKGKSAGGLYGDTVEEIDASTGRVLDALKELKLEDDTLVIYSSDNGPWLAKGDYGGSAYPLRGGKGGSYEGGFRVPCLMRLPGVIPPGSVCREMATQMDFLPTIAKLANVSVKQPIDGKDITDLVVAKSSAKTPHESFFYYVGNRLHAVRSGKWKLKVPTTFGEEFAGYAKVENGESEVPRMLFDLERDPAEQKSVLADHPDVAERLQAMVERAREELGDSKRQMAGSKVRPIGRIETAG